MHRAISKVARASAPGLLLGLLRALLPRSPSMLWLVVSPAVAVEVVVAVVVVVEVVVAVVVAAVVAAAVVAVDEFGEHVGD